MLPKVSVIIPCYNSGRFLVDAIASVEEYPSKEFYEIIIINDGSTDLFTLEVLKSIEIKHTVIHQKNGGPAAARNTGIARSNGEYILFLDSDNKIRDSFIDKSVEIFQKHQNVGVVYGNPYFFGEVKQSRKWLVHAFDFESILMFNYIDMCSMVRKSVWLELNGLDENRAIIGFEDWEFWIRVGKSGWQFYFIDELLYDYRISDGSLISQGFETERHNQALRYVYSKHIDVVVEYLLKDNYRILHEQNAVYENDKKKPFRSLVKYLYLKYLKRNNDLLNKNKPD